MPDPTPDLQHTPAVPSGRRRLAGRRTCEGFDFELGGQRYHATASLFPDGAPAEIFINAAKADSSADIVARDSAVAVSIALQYGAPVDVIRKALMRDSRGGPSGPAAYVLDKLVAEQRGPG
jgi:ribonucleoside-diphosphate reductase alpha chain